MKYSELVMGRKYKTKIGSDYQIVVLANLRLSFNEGKQEKSKEVIVETLAGNQIYRTASRLKMVD